MTRGKATGRSFRCNNPNPTKECLAKKAHSGSVLAKRHRTAFVPGRDARYARTKLTMRPPAAPYSRGGTVEALCIRNRCSDQRGLLCHAPSRHTSAAKDFGNTSVRPSTSKGPWTLGPFGRIEVEVSKCVLRDLKNRSSPS